MIADRRVASVETRVDRASAILYLFRIIFDVIPQHMPDKGQMVKKRWAGAAACDTGQFKGPRCCSSSQPPITVPFWFGDAARTRRPLHPNYYPWMLLLTGTSASAKPPIKRFAEAEAEAKAELASPGGASRLAGERSAFLRSNVFLESFYRSSRRGLHDRVISLQRDGNLKDS